MVVAAVKALIPERVKTAVKKIRHARNNACLVNRAMANMQDGLRLHLACGSKVLPDWLNVDRRPREGVMVMSMPEGLTVFPDQSASFIYCSHFLHYLDYPGASSEFVRHAHRILKPGGALRIVVPGIERIIRAYVADDAEFFKEQEKHHPPDCTTKLEHLMCALQAHNRDGTHKFGYDFETAKKLLEKAGFRRVTGSAFNQSEFEALRVDYRGKDLSLFVDAVK
jgi:predicted SAM-dependent methyltransferase